MAAKEALKLVPVAVRSESSDDEVEAPSSSEDEGEDEGSRRQNVLKVIETLDKKTQKRKKVQRSEPNLKVSEFHLSSSADGEKVDLHDLIGSLQKSSSYGGLKKKLESMEKNAGPIDVPLHKPQAEKIQRVIAYEETSKDIDKWQPIVKKNREAEHLQFPLKPYRPPDITTKTLAVTFKARTPLEEEVAAVLRGSSHTIERQNKELTEDEEQALLAMDLEEARERRHELQRLRVLQSYYEEKCRRAKKIKSKKYHRIKKRAEKRAISKLSSEELQKMDPEKAKEEMEKLDKLRAKERVSLKHRYTSKWAKNLLIRHNKDPEARRALQERLQISRELTEKQREDEEEEEEEEIGAEGDVRDDVTCTTFGGLVTSSDNPWSIDKSGVPSRTGSAICEQPEPASKLHRLQPITGSKTTAMTGTDSDSSDEGEKSDDFELKLAQPDKKSKKTKSAVMRKTKKKKLAQEVENIEGEEVKKGKKQKKGSHQVSVEKNIEHFEEEFVEEITQKSKVKPKEKKKQGKTKKIVMKEFENEKDDQSNEILLLGNSKKDFSSRGLEKDHDNAEEDLAGGYMESDKEECGGDFLESTPRENQTTITKVTLPKKIKSDGFWSSRTQGKSATAVTIDPKKIFRIEDPESRSNAMTGDECQGHLMDIQQAFANDDVIEEFVREKEEAMESSKAKDLDLTLPGWGEWGGMGLKASEKKKKKKKIVIPAKPGPPRKDKDLAHVIINEEINKKLARNQVTDVPHPFLNRVQFERSIRNPVGKHWNTANTVKELIKPRVQTLMGNIIEPIKATKELKRRRNEDDDNKPGKAKTSRKKGKGQDVGLVIHT